MKNLNRKNATMKPRTRDVKSVSLESISPSGKLFIGLLFALPCLVVLYFATLWGLADIQAYRALKQESSWRDDASFSTKSLDRATSLMRDAVQLSPSNPEYRDRLAKFQMLNYRITTDDKLLTSAREHLLVSRKVRPQWSRNWTLFIEMKHLSGEIDNEFEEAIGRTIIYGPWEPDVLVTVARYGTRHYGSLTSDAQAKVIDAIRRGMISPSLRTPTNVADAAIAQRAFWDRSLAMQLHTMLISSQWDKSNVSEHQKLVIAAWHLLPTVQRKEISRKMAHYINQGYPMNFSLFDAINANLLLCPHLAKQHQPSSFCKT